MDQSNEVLPSPVDNSNTIKQGEHMGRKHFLERRVNVEDLFHAHE